MYLRRLEGIGEFMFQLAIGINGEDTEYWNADCLVRIHILNNKKSHNVKIPKIQIPNKIAALILKFEHSHFILKMI